MKKSFFLLIVSSLLLSSCIKIDVKQTSDISGASRVSMQADMSQYIEQLKTFAASQTGASVPDMEEVDYCENAKENPVLETQDCFQKNESVFGVNGTLNLIKNGWMKVEKDATYSLDVRAMVPKVMDSDEKSFEESYSGSGADSPQSLGFVYTYTLELPAPAYSLSINGKDITVTNGDAIFGFGKIQDNILTFDIFEMLATESFVVSGGGTGVPITSITEYSYNLQKLTPQQGKNVLSALQKIQDTNKIVKLEMQIKKTIATLNLKKTLTEKEKQKLALLGDLSELVKIRLGK